MAVKKVSSILKISEANLSKYSNSRILLVLVKNAFAQLNGLGGYIYEDRLNYRSENKESDLKRSTGRLRQENFRFPQLSTIFRRENLDVNIESRNPFSTRKKYLGNFGAVEDFTNVSTTGTSESTSPDFQGVENFKKLRGPSMMLNAVISSYASAGFFYKSGGSLNLAQVNSRQENIYDYMEKIGLSFENTQDVSEMLREFSSIDNLFTRFLRIKNANVPSTDVSRVTKYLPAESDGNVSDIEFPYVPGHEIYTSLSFNNDPALNFETLDTYINDFQDFKIRINNDLNKLGMINDRILNFEKNFYRNLNDTIRESLLKIFPADILQSSKFNKALDDPTNKSITDAQAADYFIMSILSSFDYNSPQLRSLFIASYAGYLVKKGVREPIWNLSNKKMRGTFYKTEGSFRFKFSDAVEDEGKEWELTAINAVTNIFNLLLGNVLFKTDEKVFKFDGNKKRPTNIFRDADIAELDEYITGRLIDNKNPRTAERGNDFPIFGPPMAPQLSNDFYNLTPLVNILEIGRGEPADYVRNFIIRSFFVEENILDKMYERLEIELDAEGQLKSFFDSINTQNRRIFNEYGSANIANSNSVVPPQKTDGPGFGSPPRLQGRLALSFPEIDESTYAMAVFEHFAAMVKSSNLQCSLFGFNWYKQMIPKNKVSKIAKGFDVVGGVFVAAGAYAAIGLGVLAGVAAPIIGLGTALAILGGPITLAIAAVAIGIIFITAPSDTEVEYVPVTANGGLCVAFNKATVFNLVSCFMDNVLTQTLYGAVYTPLFSGGDFIDTLIDPLQQAMEKYSELSDAVNQLAEQADGAIDLSAAQVLDGSLREIEKEFQNELVFVSKLQSITGFSQEDLLTKIDNGLLSEDPETVESLKTVGFFPDFAARSKTLALVEKPESRRTEQIQKVTDTIEYLGAYLDKIKTIKTNLTNLFNTTILESGTEIVRSTERAGDLGMTFLTKDKIQNDIYHYAQRFVNGRNSTLPAILKDAGPNSFKNILKYFNQSDHGFLQDDKLGKQKSMFVGIPTGFLEKARYEAYKESNDVGYLNSNLISINLYRRNLADPTEKTYPKIFLFDTSRYVLSDDVSNIFPEQNFQLNIADSDTLEQFINRHQITRIKLSDSNATSFTPINKLDSVFKVYTGQAYDSTADTNILTPAMQESVFRNLVLDFYLKAYYRQILGLDISEYSHGLDKLDDPDLLTNQNKIDILNSLENEILVAFGYTPGDLILDSNVKQIAGVLKEIKNSVLFKSEEIQNQIIKPRIFERVFGLYFNERDFTTSAEAEFPSRLVASPNNAEPFIQDPDPEENYDNNIVPKFLVAPVPTADSRIEIKSNNETIFTTQALTLLGNDYTRSFEDGTSSYYSYYITISLLKSPE